MLNELIKAPEKEIACKNIVVVVEDSFDSACRHKRNLSVDGTQVVIFRGLEQFSRFIEDPLNAKKIKAVITDGLEGSWIGVVGVAKENHINNIWLISGNQEFVNQGKSISGLTAITKGDLERKPETYQQILTEN